MHSRRVGASSTLRATTCCTRTPSSSRGRELEMDYLMSASFACECRHGKHSNDWTPWELGWPRTVYERVVPRFWPILTRGVLPVLPDGRYSVTDLCARFDDAVKAFVELVAADDQELFLDAAG